MNEHDHDEEAARADERDAELHARDAERDPRDAERESRRAERDAHRAERDAERESRRERRHRERTELGGVLGEALKDRIRDEVRQNVRRQGLLGQTLKDRLRDELRQTVRRKWSFGFGDAGLGGDPASEANEVVEHRFTVSAMPRVSVRNVSGETEIAVGDASEVFIRARKRVHGWSEDRAKRLLENVEIRMEQNGDDILIEPRLFEQERGWLELFRGGRVAVDLDIRVPRETQLDATIVSGDLSVTGTRGPIELRSVSGEVSVDDVQGPMRVRTVSGELDLTGYAGQLEANSVSGDIRIERSTVRSPDIVTVSADVEIDAVITADGSAEGRVKTVSGDVELSLSEPDVVIDFKTVSGDAEVEGPARVEKQGRRDRRIVIGSGRGHLWVKTVSGDLSVRRREPGSARPAPEAAADAAIAMGAPASPVAGPAPEPGATAREILERVAKGELSVEEAASALDAARGR